MPKSNLGSERIPSGIVELDKMIGGGFPTGFFCSVQGDIGAGTTTFCTQVVWSRLVSGGIAAYVCLDETQERIIEHFKNFGHDVQPYIDSSQFIIMDGHPFLRSLASASQLQYGDSKNKDLLNKLLDEFSNRMAVARMKNASNKLPIVSVIDSYSSMAPYVDLRSMHVLAHIMANSARRHGTLLFAVCHGGSMEANIVSACNSVADGMIRLETNLARGVFKRFMRIEKMAFTSTPEVELECVITSRQGMQIISPPHTSTKKNREIGGLST